MNEDVIKGSLKEVVSLNEEEKTKFTEMSFKATNDIFNKKGNGHRARQVKVSIGVKDGKEVHIIATDYNISKKKYPTAEDKLNVIGLANNVTKKLKKDINDGKINNTHITDISKMVNLDELIKIDSSSQQKIIDNIITNRNERNLINSEFVTTYAINIGNTNSRTIEIWYKALIRVLNRLSELLNVKKEATSFLSTNQKKELLRLIARLIEQLNNFKSKLKDY